ncbi:MAG: hypothetical protein ABIZ64_08925 [Casimicrobium sp.]
MTANITAATSIASHLKWIFWSVAAIDGAVLLVVLISALTHDGGSHNDGGREMGVIFFLVVPGVALALAVLLFIFTQHIVWRSLAILIVAGPGLYLLVDRANSLKDSFFYFQKERGSGYFSMFGSQRALRSLAEAVVTGDITYLKTHAVAVDLNAKGDRGVTLLKIAVREAKKQEFERRQPIDSQLAVIKTLLALGARPGDELREALEIHDPAVLKTLLDNGADPNQKDADGRWLMAFDHNQTPLQHFRLLTEHGMNVDMMDGDEPLDVELAIYQRWDLVAHLIERGADYRKPRADDGRTVASVLAQQIAEDARAKKAATLDLLRVQTLINDKR